MCVRMCVLCEVCSWWDSVVPCYDACGGGLWGCEGCVWCVIVASEGANQSYFPKLSGSVPLLITQHASAEALPVIYSCWLCLASSC